LFSLVVECVLLVETLVSHTSLFLSLDGLYCFTFQHMQKCLWALQYLCKTNQIEIDVNLKKVLWTWVSNSPSLHIIFDLWKKFCNGKNVRFFESAFDKTHFGEKMPIKYVCNFIWYEVFFMKRHFDHAFPMHSTLTSHTILISNVFWVLPYNEPPTIFSMKVNWQIKIKK
jgi:hypothetical protein